MTFTFSPDDALVLNANVDAGLKRAARAVLRDDAEVERLRTGIVHSYKLRVRTQAYHARVFRYDNFPVLSSLRWTFGALETAGISSPRLVHGERRGGDLPYGFMLTDWLPGDTARNLLDANSLTESELMRDLGAYLARVHRISTPSFGPTGAPGWLSLRECLDAVRTDIGVEMLLERGRITTSWLDALLASFQHLLHQVGTEPRPVLTHGDPNPTNVLIAAGQPLAMVDWDHSEGHVWVRDLALLTFGADDPSAARASFLAGHGNFGMNADDIVVLERICQGRHALGMMAFFVWEQPSEEGFARMKEQAEAIVIARA